MLAQSRSELNDHENGRVVYEMFANVVQIILSSGKNLNVHFQEVAKSLIYIDC